MNETVLDPSPPQAVHFATYEAAMLWLNPEKSYNPYHHALAGAVAGGAAATAALPLDACKTLLNTQEVQLHLIVTHISYFSLS